jgi:glycosyltransferase involved in cell wall biosynthesis
VKRKRWIVTRHNSERFLPIGPLFFSVSLSNVISIKAFRIIAISNAVFEYLHSSKEVLVKRKIEIVKYGYDNENLQLQNRSIDSKKVRTPINLICVSRLVEQKNLPLLLKATHEFKKRGIPVLLNIYGDGNLHDRLVRQSKVLEIDEIVKFQGKVENIYEFMRESDFLIHTSKYEGFGMVFIEAMQIGLPIITCKNAATEEVLGKDYIGLVDQDDVEAIVDKVIFLNDEVRKNQAIAYLKSRLDNFNPVLMERQISQIYFQRIE